MAHEHILVLEDHAELCEEIRQTLTNSGFYVQVAATAAEAIAVARREPIDLLVADVFLPDFSGIEAFQEIRRSLPDIAGIVITGYSTWQMAMDALRTGFVGFVVKPFVPEQLIAGVVNALEQEKLRRENARLRALVPLYELSRSFMGTVELTDLLNQIITTARQETKAEVVSLMLLDADRRELRIAGATGLPAGVIEKHRQSLGNGIAGRVAATGEPLMITDDLPRDPEIRNSLLGRSEILSALSLPLISRGQVIGVLNLSRMRGGEPFSSSDLELATVLASQAAISIDNANLFNHVKLLSEMSQSLARSVDLDEAVGAIVSAPQHLTNARSAALWLFEDDLVPKLIKTEGLGDTPPPMPSVSRVVEDYVVEGDHGWLMLPLQHSDKTLGVLSVQFPLPNPPRAERLGLLRTLAHAASASIESHRLRASEVKAFVEIDRAVRSDLSVRQLLGRLLGQMIQTCHAESGAIFLWDPEHDRLDSWVTEGTPIREEYAWTVIRENRSGLLTDTHGSPDAAMGAPMRVGSRIEGAIILTRSHTWGPFVPRQLELLSTLSSSAALIVRNTQLYARSEEAAIAEERTRIAREIHDGLAQDLSFLVLKASAAMKLLVRGEERGLQRELEEIATQLRQDAREVRRVIFALRPLDIESLGFMPALEKFVREFAQANDIETEFRALGDVNLSPKLETALFRLVQEGLNNIRKHAHAKHAWVDLEYKAGNIASLKIRDDGQGFDVESTLLAARGRGRVGLVQMQERAERAGGVFGITSTPNEGTCIQVQLPIREI
ncbi:MAG: GAF domain-containing protein [Acidobacteriota bacterium]